MHFEKSTVDDAKLAHVAALPRLEYLNLYGTGVTDAGLGLLVADPYPFLPDYNVKLEAPEKKTLRVENIRQIAVLVTVTIPKDSPELTTLNLSGPIILNTKERLGLQAPQVDAKHPTHYRLVDGQRPQKPAPE